jgi:cell division protein FtsB
MKVIPEETFASVLRRIIEQAERVPALEKRIQELKDENEKLKEENTDLDQRVEELMSGELD